MPVITKHDKSYYSSGKILKRDPITVHYFSPPTYMQCFSQHDSRFMLIFMDTYINKQFKIERNISCLKVNSFNLAQFSQKITFNFSKYDNNSPTSLLVTFV
jgi:hypothetical protein